MQQSFNYLPPESLLKCLQKLGEGSYGSVFLVEEISTRDKYALKRSVKNSKYISREIMILDLLKNQDFIMHMYTAFFTRDLKGNLIQNILLEYKPYTLYQLIYEYKSRGQHIKENLLKNIIRSILKGLLTMHNQLIAHRDLKPENILLNENLEPCIGDLGSAKQLDPNKKHNPYVCTVLYRAPELIWGSDNYTVQVDMWSLGCIIVEMIFQKPVFYCTEPEHIFPAILHRLGGFNKQVKDYYCNQVLKVSPQIVYEIDQIFEKETEFFTWMKNKSGVPFELVDLIYQMLRFNPNKRITAQDALDHPYLSDIRRSYYNQQRQSSGQSQLQQERQRQNQQFTHSIQYEEEQSIYGYQQELDYRNYLEDKQFRKIQDIYKYQKQLVQQNIRGLQEWNRYDNRQYDLGQQLTTFQIEQFKQQQHFKNENRQSKMFMQSQQRNHQVQVQQQQKTQRQGPKLIGGGFETNISQWKSQKFGSQNIQGNLGSNMQQEQRLDQNHFQQSQVGTQQGFTQGSWNSNFKQQQSSSVHGYSEQILKRELNNSQQGQQQLAQQPQQIQESKGQMRQIYYSINNTLLEQGQHQQQFGELWNSSVFGQGQSEQYNIQNQIPNLFSSQNVANSLNMLNYSNFNQQSEKVHQSECQKNFSQDFGIKQKSWIELFCQDGQQQGQVHK